MAAKTGRSTYERKIDRHRLRRDRLSGGCRREVETLSHQLPDGGIRRPSEFRKAIAGADRRVLAKQLRELEQTGIIRKKVYPVIPQKTEYFLTDLGESVVPVIRAMDDWGNAHRSVVE